MSKDDELREAGLKVTLPRLKVLKILEQATEHHLSAEDIYKALLDEGEDVGLATVYRVLTQFEAAGLIRRHNFAGGHSIFELEQGEHHDHLVCIQCGKVAEFVNEAVERHQIEIAKKAGYTITDHQHTIYGVCRDCVKKGKPVSR